MLSIYACCLLAIVGCDVKMPFERIPTESHRQNLNNTFELDPEDRVRHWLAKNSYAMRFSGARHIVPSRPTMNWDKWIAEGKSIPYAEVYLRKFLVQRDRLVELPAVAEVLGTLGDSNSVPTLLSCLSSSEPRLRLEAVCSLGKLQDERAIEPLAKLFQIEPEENVRANIVVALIKSGGENARVYVEKATDDESDFVSGIAREALAHLAFRR